MNTLRIAAIVAATPFALLAQADFHWQGRVNPGQTVEIRNINGTIHAETANGSDIVADAHKSSHRSDINAVRIDVVPHAGGVTLCAVYPSDSGTNECKPGGGRMNTNNNDVKVDFIVKVPVGVKLAARSVNGAIEAVALRSDIDASTVNGKIDVATSEQATAKTVNGGIHASVGHANSTQPLKFETVNGGIEVAMPDGINAEVSASTVNGGISTDFPLTVTGKVGPKNLKGRLGSGGRDLKLSTVNGSIAIKRGA